MATDPRSPSDGDDKADQPTSPVDRNESLAGLEPQPRLSDNGRSVFVIALIVVGCFMAAAAAVSVWARTTALNTDAYVDTVSSLPDDPAVSIALADNVVDLILSRAHVEEQVRQRLPEDMVFLASPLANGIRDVAIEAADAFVSSDEFRAGWEKVNRAAHLKAVAILTGRSVIEASDEGEVVVDLTEIAAAVRSRLEQAELGVLLPPPRAEAPVLVLFEVGNHGVLELTVDLLDLAYWILPLLALLALGGAIWLSRDRRLTWFHMGIGLAIAMAVSLILLAAARAVVVGEVGDPINQAAIAALWDRLFDNLIDRHTVLLVVSISVAVIAFLSGSHPRAVAFRSAIPTSRDESPQSALGATVGRSRNNANRHRQER